MIANFHFRRCRQAILIVLVLGLPEARGQSKEQTQVRQQEERLDYYTKWLKEDVVYIITDEERKVFESLSTPEENEQFIEQFWYRRDPDPTTSTNVFKEEHYRRIAYSNEHFRSGKSGWKTDRGRTYIKFGPPDEIESHPTLEHHRRLPKEGVGDTVYFPHEIWRYRHLEGIGSDIVFEFVDRNLTGEYRLAVHPYEKDALLNHGGSQVVAEEMLAMQVEDEYGAGVTTPFHFEAASKESIFERYERYAQVYRPQPIKYKDLQEVVRVNVSYADLPIKVRQDCFRLNDQQVLVPITVQIDNKELTFTEERGTHTAKLAVYGIVTSITNRIVTEFEDDLITSFKAQYLDRGRLMKSLYQKILPLDRKMRYKLDLVVKDVASGKMGVVRQAIVPTPFGGQRLSSSSLVLTDSLRQLRDVPTDEEMFVLGDVWIRPSLEKSFLVGLPLVTYLQVYNASLDQATLAPSLRVTYTITDEEGTRVRAIEDEKGQSIQFHSAQRVVLIAKLPMHDLSPGQYKIDITVKDQIQDQTLTVSEKFRIANRDAWSLARELSR